MATEYCGWVLVKLESKHTDKTKQVAKAIKKKYIPGQKTNNQWYAVRADRIDNHPLCDIVVPAVLHPPANTKIADVWKKVVEDIEDIQGVGSATPLKVVKVPESRDSTKDSDSGHHPWCNVKYAEPDPDPDPCPGLGERPENAWG